MTIGCCAKYESGSNSAERTPNPVLNALDGCNNKVVYKGKDGETFELFMPVKPTSVPGEVEPAPDGVDAIGISTSAMTATATDYQLITARTGHVWWSDMAPGIGADPTSMADWWAIHTELAKLNIYVEFK